MHLRGPSLEELRRDSRCRRHPAGTAKEQPSRDSEHLPMRKQKLRLRGVGELQWTHEETRSLKMRDHVLKMITQVQQPNLAHSAPS
jgi:hypothetical protein